MSGVHTVSYRSSSALHPPRLGRVQASQCQLERVRSLLREITGDGTSTGGSEGDLPVALRTALETWLEGRMS